MNNHIFSFFYNFAHQSATLDQLIYFFAVYFPYIVGLLAFIFLISHCKENPLQIKTPVGLARWKELLYVFISSSLAWGIGKILKTLIHTNRPFVQFSNIHSLFYESGYAFPSGHAAFFSAMAVAIFLCHKKAGYWFGFFALVIGLARIAAGVHYPIDILGGFALGALVSYSVAYFIKNV